MRCVSCMTANPIGNRFCENCGGQLHLTCSACGHEASLTARYCGNCGNSLLSAAVPMPTMEHGPKWGELKQATVLFADIVGSTELVANLDPEQAMGRLRPAVLRMRHSIERFGGTVVRTLGDGVMALFGVPRTLEGHALLACQAALHMQNAFKQGPDGLSIRVGLHSGQVASDPEDAADGHGGGAHGLTIHLASRVIALAEPGGICLTEACRAAAGPTCEVRAIGAHRLKGIPQPVEILQLAGIAAHPRRGAAQLLAQTTFRGRSDELEFLHRSLRNLQDGAVQMVGVVGEPGSGKSRLCHEFAQACRSRGMPVYEVRAQPYGHALPLQPILELFRGSFFGIGSLDDAVTARARIARRFEPLQPTAADLDLLYEFFGVAPPGAVPVALGPRARQARLLARLKELVQLDAGTERLILIEDLHWLDEASEDFIAALGEAVIGTRTLLLLNYRLAYRCPWLGVPHFAQLQLGELPSADMDALVAELLAPLSALPDICRLVCQRSAGNPFFAEELVRTLADSRLLASDTGLPVGGMEAVERALPATLQAVIGARLDRLGEPEKTLLQMCAIIGKEIPLAVLEHVASPLASQIERGLEGLCQAGLILPQPSRGGRRFVFRHPLIQEVAYGAQLKVRRGQVHANVAAAMELYYAEQLDEFAALVAYHYEQAGLELPAARYNARAAAWLGSSNAAQAIKHWRKVRQLLDGVDRTAEVDRLRVTAGGKIALLGWREGLTLQEVQPLIDEAVALANEADDRLVPWLLTIEGRMLVASGGPADGYVDRVKKALLYIDVDRDPGRVAVAHAFLSQAYAWAGLLQEALDANDVALANAASVDAFDREFIGFSIEQWVLSTRSRLLIRLGRMEEAKTCLNEILALEATSAEAPVPGMSRLGFVELAWALRDAALAEEHSIQLVHAAEKNGTPYLKTFSQGYRGLAAMVAGDHTVAVECFQAALALARASGAAREFETEVLAGLAECRLQMGHHLQAMADANEAIELACVRGTRIAECRALITRGVAALAVHGASAAAAADADFTRADALIGVTGAAVLRAVLERARAEVNAVRAA